MNAPFHSPNTTAAQAAARLNLTLGRDGTWRGQCPSCRYGKPSLTIGVRGHRIAVSCAACGDVGRIASAAGISPDLLLPEETGASKIARALTLWKKGSPARGTAVEAYLRGRGITISPPPTMRFVERQRNWADGKFYSAMISLVERMPAEDDHPAGRPVATGVHLTFLHGPDRGGGVRKAKTEANKLTRGQLRYGGVWLTPYPEIGSELAVAEGIETGLAVQQLTRIPTVATLSAAGMRSFRWPPSVRRLWIAADNDEVGLGAAEALALRALDAGLEVHIKIPARGRNDFNDVLLETK